MSVTNFNQSLITNAEFLMPFAYTLTHDHEDAKDLFQETVYKALANKDKYSIGTNIKAWLYTIMRNIFINDYRKKSKQRVMFDGTTNDFFINSTKAITVNNAIESINIKEMQKAIINLPDIFKDPFLLYFDGYKYNEIADMLCEPLGTIKSRIHFARKLLKVQIERS
ncbi:MAG: RNA polymerase sigma factor [Parafilimonas sp.]